MMTPHRRRPDRARGARARRAWWTRHGAFSRGVLAGISLSVLVFGMLRWAHYL